MRLLQTGGFKAQLLCRAEVIGKRRYLKGGA